MSGNTPARSRKRGQRSKPVAAASATQAPERGTAERPSDADPPVPSDADPPVVSRSRSEERNAAVRATLTPLAPGERPWAIRIAAVIALLIGGGDLVEALFGGRIKFGSTHASVGGIVLFSVLMLVCAVGMWQMRYWAVLGFQAILALVILVFSVLLIRASNLLGFAVSIVIIGGGGWLFYKLVRVLSRIQMPKYPSV